MTNTQLFLEIFAAVVTTLGAFTLAYLIRIEKHLTTIVTHIAQEEKDNREKQSLIKQLITSFISTGMAANTPDDMIPVEINMNKLHTYPTRLLELALKHAETEEDYASATHFRNELLRRKSK